MSWKECSGVWSYRVSEDEDSVRVDRIVSGVCHNFGLRHKLFRRKKVKVNGKTVTHSHRVHKGEVIEIHESIECCDNSVCVPDDFLKKLQSLIVFENNDFFAINKPAGLAVQGGINVSMCVDQLLKARHDCQCRLVHRIDQDTSGLLLIAKNRAVAQYLTQLFKDNKIRKTYLAVVDGLIEGSGTISNFLGEYQQKMRVVAEGGQPAITHYKAISQLDGRTLLELKPATGRKHQLRVHCAQVLCAPIVGDKKYGDGAKSSKLLLHAYKLQIGNIRLVADVPSYFRNYSSSDSAD